MNNSLLFAEPLWLVMGLAVIVLLVVLFKKMGAVRQKELARFASSSLLVKLCANVSRRRRNIKKILLFLAVACCFTGLARPQYGFRWVDVKRKGIDILFAIDTSRSMLAEDVTPNRLQRAKYGILDFVGQLEGDRVGLMPFAGTSFLLCPMTIDYSAFESSLEAIDTSIIPKGGTDIAAAIREAENVLANEANHKILVLITDGEELQGDAVVAAREAAAKGMTIYTVGVGSSQGELIPLNVDGKAGFVKDAEGRFVTSRLDEKGLTEIAQAASGLYVPMGTGGEGLQVIYQEKLSLVPKEELAERRHKLPLERFSWPVGGAIFLLMVEFVISGRKSRRSLRLPFVKTAGRRNRGVAAMVLLCCLPLLPGPAEGSEGERAYGAGEYLKASEYYSAKLAQSPDDAALNYNFGTAAYKNNLFQEAADSFAKALNSDNLDLQEHSYYNRGNALYQLGLENLQTDRQHAMELWQQAVDSYDGVLQLNSMNDDARFNQNIVRKKLEELKKQEEQEQKQDQQDQGGEDQKEENKEKQQGNNQQKDQETDWKQDEKQNSGKDESSADNEQQNDGQQGEKQEQEQEQGDDSKTPRENSGNMSEEDEKGDTGGIGEERQENTDDENEQEQKALRDMERKEQGKMTSEEALQLLNSLKDEEGELNFVPANMQKNRLDKETTRDW